MKSLGVFMFFATVCVVGMGVLIYMYRAPPAADTSVDTPASAPSRGLPDRYYPDSGDPPADLGPAPAEDIVAAKNLIQIGFDQCMADAQYMHDIGECALKYPGCPKGKC